VEEKGKKYGSRPFGGMKNGQRVSKPSAPSCFWLRPKGTKRRFFKNARLSATYTPKNLIQAGSLPNRRSAEREKPPVGSKKPFAPLGQLLRLYRFDC